MVEHLPCVCKALGSVLSAGNKKSVKALGSLEKVSLKQHLGLGVLRLLLHTICNSFSKHLPAPHPGGSQQSAQPFLLSSKRCTPNCPSWPSRACIGLSALHAPSLALKASGGLWALPAGTMPPSALPQHPGSLLSGHIMPPPAASR